MNDEIDRFSMDYFRLDGKVAIVTGANMGLGMAYAAAFAKAGADLYIPHFTGDVAEITEIVETEGRKVAFLQGDLTDSEYMDRIVADCLSTYGGIDILVNNAGGPPPGDEGNGAAPRRQRGIQSIEVGGQILVALSDHASALSLKQLAEAAQMTPAKARDLSGALTTFRHALQGTEWDAEPAVRFAVAHVAARNFIGAAGHLARCRTQMPPAEWTTAMARCRDDFLQQSPLSPAQLERAYVTRGWWLRGLKFHRHFSLR